MVYNLSVKRKRKGEKKMRYIAYATNEKTYTRLPFNTKMGARYMAERLTEKPYNWPKAQVIDTETGEILCEFERA